MIRSSEIMVNGPNLVYVERSGKVQETEIRFRDNEDLMRIVDRIVAPLGRRVDESSPMVDARLPDGSRVNIIIPPLALNGPCMSIRKFSRAAYGMDDLIRMGALTQNMTDFLRVCVLARCNIVISGGTSSGKTTFLNLLSSFLPQRRAYRHHRGRCGVAIAAEACGAAGIAAAQRRGVKAR